MLVASLSQAGSTRSAIMSVRTERSERVPARSLDRSAVGHAIDGATAPRDERLPAPVGLPAADLASRR
jgi:hypothetical protein